MSLAELSGRAGMGFRLSRPEARAAMDSLIDGAVPDGEKRDFLLAMNTRAPSSEELAGLAEALRARAGRGTRPARRGGGPRSSRA